MTRRTAFALLLILFTALDVSALVIPSNEGKWPAHWPKELESLRKQSKTLDVATGIQEHIYTIPFETREEFEKLWPALMKVRTPSSPVVLSKVGQTDKGWGDFLPNAKPCVRIKGPSGGYIGSSAKIGEQINLKELDAGTMIFACAPWPKDLLGPNGELPEYVTDVSTSDGKLSWKSLDSVPGSDQGFRHRARIDMELILDGQVIDLNRIRLPEDAKIIDRRFETEVAK